MMTGLFVLASLVVLALAIYAGRLLYQLRHQRLSQTAHIARMKQQRNDTLLGHIRDLAKAGEQDMGVVSEVVIRIYQLWIHLQPAPHGFAEAYPACFELYEIVCDMPRGEQRQTYRKKERMAFDLQRLKAEARLGQRIEEELLTLSQLTY
ncbi:hypothetical protein VST7929_00134 [Vibrio stylophorae]|uniref:DUF2489 domain-containing protein n=1 Tax=Vibrio stylophorae TaxID=659351 RepID=A0ABN8DSC5_9VIBR|nr:DUF2489 domain-containing protein [Vibrio stylophorae]CAH0532317.1 hypothetical protein VST7929_00134 [Vibrio stylophorae]